MIIEMTKDIVDTLISIPEVIKWVAKVDGIPNISANKLPSASYPAITIYERENDPEKYADDEEITSILSFQISLFSKDGSHGKIQNLIDSKIKEMGFTRMPTPPFLFEDKTNIGQKVLLYSQEIEH